MNSYNRSLPTLAFWNSRVIIRLLDATSGCYGKRSEGMWMLEVFLLSVPEILPIIYPEGQQGERKALKGSTEFKVQHANNQGSPSGDMTAAQQVFTHTTPAQLDRRTPQGPHTREHPLLESPCTPHTSGHL